MDINPYRFEAPWTAYEFTNHALAHSSQLILMTMAWLNSESMSCPVERAEEPNRHTLWYWLARLEPLLEARDGREVLIAFCNRSGSEGTAHYAGTSAVLGFRNGVVTLYGLLGEGQEKLLVVDTKEDAPTRRVLIS